MSWTADSVLALAPDPASAQAARGLASASKWVTRGTDGVLAWGEAKGSGANPYQVAIDLGEPAYRCSCPSRKIPCKHVLGLFLQVAAGDCPSGVPSDAAAEWHQKRQQKAIAKTAPPSVVADPKAREKRADERRAKVSDGVAHCREWLRDTMRQGLVSATVSRANYFESMAARMTDAQAPGLARRLRVLAADLHSGEAWQERVARGLADLHLIIEAYERISTLPEDLQDEVRAAIGYTVDRDQLTKEAWISDDWMVVGQYRFTEGPLETMRSWLWGKTCSRWAMVLAFSVNRSPFDPALAAGYAFPGSLAFYPGTERLRAAVIERGPASVPFFPPTNDLEFIASALARCPWTEVHPLVLPETRVSIAGDGHVVLSSPLGEFPTTSSYRPWNLLARSGGAPTRVMGEWDGFCFRPLAHWHNERWSAP